uniref:Putative secreted protein n=1 Tax=Ixodes ricinus TaxID=34613 RepID=A0A6B0TST1_IXORI
MPPSWYSLVMMGLHTCSSSFCRCSYSSLSASCTNEKGFRINERQQNTTPLKWSILNDYASLDENLPGLCPAT